MTVAVHGSHFAVIDARGFVDVFESSTLRLTARTRPSRRRVTNAAIAPEGRTLARLSFFGDRSVDR